MPRPTAASEAVRTLARRAAAAVVAALLAAAPARAAVAVQRSVEDLARTSDAVVRGRVERTASFRSGRRIFTEAQVRTAAVWRGAAPPLVRVVVPGGVVGDVGQRVDGAATLAGGEEVVLFLSAAPTAFHVNELAQGKFRVDGEAARPDVSRVRFAGSRVREGERGVEEMPLAELERRVREAR